MRASAFLALVLSACLFPLAASGMTFALERFDARSAGLDLYQIVYASGPIAAGDADRLRAKATEWKLIPGAVVYFDSNGGNLVEAMKMGRTIRELQFETQIGIEGDINREKTSHCISACTIAFLGGVYRNVSANAIFGVHRFYAEDGSLNGDNAQLVSALLVEYIQSMGVSPSFISYMTDAGPAEINALSTNTMNSLGITNGWVRSTVWSWMYNNGFTWLRGIQDGRRGVNKLTFACYNDKIMFMGFLDSPDPQKVTKERTDFHWIVDESFVPLRAGEDRPVVEVSGNYVVVTQVMDKRRFSELNKAETFGFALDMGAELYAGFSMSLSDAKQNLRELANSCHMA